MERERFRQGLRSNPQGLALTGSHARLCFDSFGGKTGGVRVVAALSSLRVEGSLGCSRGSEWRLFPLGNPTGGYGAVVCIADCRAQRVGVFPVHHANDPPSADSSQDHEPVLVHTLLYRGNHIRRYRYIVPKPLLVRDVRWQHADMGNHRTETGSSKKWGGGRAHTLSFLLYRWPVEGQAGKVAWSSVRPVCPSGCCPRKSDLSVSGFRVSWGVPC